MIKSTSRILCSHAGSLPRPPALTALYAARARGQSVDAAELARTGTFQAYLGLVWIVTVIP